MKKKALVVLMTGAMALGLAACGGSSSSSTTTSTASKTTSTTSTSGSGTTLRLINGKIEVDAQLKELAKAYQAESGVEVVIESMGGGVD
ncbi:MAG: carbohydrate ABC transporter substrate-binding protein, partial [bacterium]